MLGLIFRGSNVAVPGARHARASETRNHPILDSNNQVKLRAKLHLSLLHNQKKKILLSSLSGFYAVMPDVPSRQKGDGLSSETSG